MLHFNQPVSTPTLFPFFFFMFRIIVAVDDTPVSRKAISYGLRLHESIADSSIQFVFAVGLNPTSNTSIHLL